MRFIAHLREKRVGKITIDAQTPQEALLKARRLIHTGQLPNDAIEKETGLIITYIEEVTPTV